MFTSIFRLIITNCFVGSIKLVLNELSIVDPLNKGHNGKNLYKVRFLRSQMFTFL